MKVGSASGRPILPILALTAILCLPHCSSDDNGGGGGNGGGETPSEGPVTTSIYLWITSCNVPGDMNDCGNTTPGRAGADSICEARYATDVDPIDSERIDSERGGAPSHKALLADRTLHPKDDTGIPNKETRAIQKPDLTLITDSWADFFDSSMTVGTIADGTIDDATLQLYWTGLNASFTLGVHCQDWMSAISGVRGNTGVQPSSNTERLGFSDASCLSSYKLLCITH